MANLLVEIGNTALKAAWAEETVLGKTFRYQGEKVVDYILSIIEKEKPEILAIVSKVDISPEDREKLERQCEKLFILDKNYFTGNYHFPEYLSGERVSSMIAVRYLFKSKSVSVFDFGTTMSVDFLKEDGTYEGGIISPGCRTRFKALNRYSRSLPLVDTPAEVKEEGLSLVSSIETGVVQGMMFEIDGYVRLHPENIVVFTGGDAAYFADRMKSAVFTVNNLVLMGLSIITDDYVKKGID